MVFVDADTVVTEFAYLREAVVTSRRKVQAYRLLKLLRVGLELAFSGAHSPRRRSTDAPA